MRRKNFKEKNLAQTHQRFFCESKLVIKVLTKVLKTMKTCFIRHNYHVLISKHLSSLASQSRTRNFCSITMRSRSVYRAFRMSRYGVHAKGQEGLLLGVSKASW